MSASPVSGQPSIICEGQQLFRFVQHLPSSLRHASHLGVARAGIEQA
jgi:hypothetical protein